MSIGANRVDCFSANSTVSPIAALVFNAYALPSISGDMNSTLIGTFTELTVSNPTTVF